MQDKSILERIKELLSFKTAKNNFKAKKLAMRKNIKLGEMKKNFCKKCFSDLIGKTRIKNGFKVINCEKCGTVSRWRIKK